MHRGFGAMNEWTDKPTTYQQALDNLTAENWHTERALIEQKMLTPQEWDDLAAICGHYAWDVRNVVGDADMTVVTRRAKLCERIISENPSRD
jgi:hypothetical protein